MSKGKNIVVFLFGVAAGSMTTWLIAKKKYEQINKEDIESVITVFKKRESELLENKDLVSSAFPDVLDSIEADEEAIQAKIARIAKEKPVISDCSKKAQDFGYKDYSTIAEKSVEKIDDKAAVLDKKERKNRPYVIEPDNFGDYVGYDTATLYYYQDGILTEEDGEIIDNIDDVIGSENIIHFGDYGEDALYVRNDKFKCDYEILLDEDKYYNYPD